LDKFSDNMLMGATNAFTGETGKGTNSRTGATGEPIAKIARHYKSSGRIHESNLKKQGLLALTF
jgi:aconitate hydratase A / 2-methylisocitrate dehydratase